MIITSIKQQVKQKNRYSIFVDGKYAFSLSEGALLDSKIVSGQEIDPTDLKRFKQLSAEDKITGVVLRYAAQRPHSEWEIQEYLRRKQASEPASEKILQKLRHIGLIDDAAFARSWVENRRLLKPTSRRKLQLELQQKRVSQAVIDEVMRRDSQEIDERSVLYELAKKKRTRYSDKTKLMQYLARQGYGYDDIKSVLGEIEA